MIAFTAVITENRSRHPSAGPSLFTIPAIPVFTLIDFPHGGDFVPPPFFLQGDLRMRRAEVYRLLNSVRPFAEFFIHGNDVFMHAGNHLDHLVAEEVHLVVGGIKPVGQLLNGRGKPVDLSVPPSEMVLDFLLRIGAGGLVRAVRFSRKKGVHFVTDSEIYLLHVSSMEKPVNAYTASTVYQRLFS